MSKLILQVGWIVTNIRQVEWEGLTVWLMTAEKCLREQKLVIDIQINDDAEIPTIEALFAEMNRRIIKAEQSFPTKQCLDELKYLTKNRTYLGKEKNKDVVKCLLELGFIKKFDGFWIPARNCDGVFIFPYEYREFK